MIARWNALEGGIGGRTEFMQHANRLVGEAQRAGQVVSGEVQGTQVTIYRLGETFMKVDQATGVILSYVPRAEGGWGIVRAYQRLGGT
jgi:hypothetical protein